MPRIKNRLGAPALAELMARLERDRPLLADAFGAGESPGRPAAITPVGDPHEGNRRVSVIRFSSGLRLVYKPRTVAAEAVWYRLVSWLNARAGKALLAAPAVLDRGEYGWVAWLRHRPPAGAPERRRYYRRSGTLLALLDILEVRDATVENLVAWRGYPVLVDPETIAHPRTAPYRASPSIALTGFLPGPGDPAGRAGIFAGYRRGSPHPAGHAEDVVAGYRIGYDLLRRWRTRLLSATGPLAGLGGIPVRVLLRSTGVYVPSLGTRSWSAATRPPLPLPRAVAGRAVAHEKAALAAGDIPVFRVRAGGRVLIPGGTAFPLSGAGAISRRLARLSQGEREEAASIIRGSLVLAGLVIARPPSGRGPL
jgi:hypothetical protein